MDPIKEAFSRAKEDITSLKNQITSLYVEINSLKDILTSISRHIDEQKQAIRQSNSTDNRELTEPSVNNNDFWSHKALKPHIYTVSTRNDGVPTDKQTDQQTNTFLDNPSISTGNTHKKSEPSDITSLLNSLSTFKKDLRNKFKRLTKQEMLVYITIYQLESEGFTVDYPLIAKKLFLSESSIRDYVQRAIRKGIEISKVKENNKKIYLSIPSEIREIASLQTIIQLREI